MSVVRNSKKRVSVIFTLVKQLKILKWLKVLLLIFVVLNSGAIWAVLTTSPVMVNNQVSVSYGGLRLNRSTNTFDTLVTLTNTSAKAIEVPIQLVISNISMATVSLANAGGALADGKRYIQIPFSDGVMDPGEAVSGVLLKFNNPQKLSFTFSNTVLGVLPTSNQPPIAKAGTYRDVALNSTVQLSGAGSSDPDGNALTYAWSLTSKPAGSVTNLSSATLANPTFVADQPGSYVVSLVVSDGTLSSSASTATIIANALPLANAGVSQTVAVNTTVNLNGSASSDPENQALTYEWTLNTKPAGSNASLTNPTTVNPSFIPDRSGNYVVSLSVYDGINISALTTVTILVNNSVNITSPASLITVGHTPLAIQGTVSDKTSTVTLNGVQVVVNGNGSFGADVTLQEGHNVVVARAVDAQGQETTDSISVALDMTPPYITLESPLTGATVFTSIVNISGLVNDIVRGTVANGQAVVTVNGVTAAVSNRSYTAEGITLTPGSNTLEIRASDNVGNTASITGTVIYQVPNPKHIELNAGQNQTGKIQSDLLQPLKAKLIAENGTPVANQPVVFRVIQGDGILTGANTDQGQGVLVNTNAQGIAQASFKLGSHAGEGNQRVRATAVGFDGEAVFAASANPNSGNKVSINSGNNQRGASGQILPAPFVAVVTDEGANVVQGSQIEFKVTQGSGKFQDGSTTYVATTDSDGRATAQLTLGTEEGLDVHRVSATLVGSSLYAGFTSSALKSGLPGNTSISGVVLDNQDHPLPGATIRVENTTRQAVSDAQGHFLITDAPVGPVHLIVDGSTIAGTDEYPTLPYNLVTIAGAENPLSAPVYLVKLNTASAVNIGTQDVSLTLAEVPGFKLDVKAGSVTFPNGQKTGRLSVTPVNADKVPMAPPNGMQPQFIVTIQPVGAKFDPPAALQLPNVDGHKPGAQVEMYSYDHDLEEFVSIGLGTVNAEGSVIKSNQGVGVIKAGWHCGSQPGGAGCAAGLKECQKCEGNCVITTLPNVPEVKGDCQSPKDCKSSQDNNADVPPDIKGDCKKSSCDAGTPNTANDDSDKPTDQCCFKGNQLPKLNNPYDKLIAECENRHQVKESTSQHEIDGCTSSPDDLESWDNLPFAINYNLYVTNPIWGTVLGNISNAVAATQTLPCNLHDICYQKCGENKATCDKALGDGVTASCDIGYPFPCARADASECVEYEEEYNSCRTIGPEYASGVAKLGGAAYKERQTQYCECC